MVSLLLAASPEWHFSAIQYALLSGDRMLAGSLLNDRTWYSYDD